MSASRKTPRAMREIQDFNAPSLTAPPSPASGRISRRFLTSPTLSSSSSSRSNTRQSQISPPVSTRSSTRKSPRQPSISPSAKKRKLSNLERELLPHNDQPIRKDQVQMNDGNFESRRVWRTKRDSDLEGVCEPERSSSTNRDSDSDDGPVLPRKRKIDEESYVGGVPLSRPTDVEEVRVVSRNSKRDEKGHSSGVRLSQSSNVDQEDYWNSSSRMGSRETESEDVKKGGVSRRGPGNGVKYSRDEITTERAEEAGKVSQEEEWLEDEDGEDAEEEDNDEDENFKDEEIYEEEDDSEDEDEYMRHRKELRTERQIKAEEDLSSQNFEAAPDYSKQVQAANAVFATWKGQLPTPRPSTGRSFGVPEGERQA